MDKVITEDIGALYQHYPRVAVVVTAQAKGRDNAMAVAWHTCISFKPPLYGVSIAPKRFTYQLIADSKEFGVNFLPFAEAEHLLREVFTPEETLDLDKVSPILYLGHELYLTASKDTRYLDREVYGKQ